MAVDRGQIVICRIVEPDCVTIASEHLIRVGATAHIDDHGFTAIIYNEIPDVIVIVAFRVMTSVGRHKQAIGGTRDDVVLNVDGLKRRLVQ